MHNSMVNTLTACLWGAFDFIVLIGLVVTLHTDVKEMDNMTPLHLACERGHKEVVQYLVEEAKCDVGESIVIARHNIIYGIQ